MPHKRWMTAKEAAHLQGFGASEYGIFDGLADKEVQDLVGNAFSTTVLEAMILAALTSWARL